MYPPDIPLSSGPVAGCGRVRQIELCWFIRKDQPLSHFRAMGFAEAVGHPVRMKSVPRDTWEALFRSQGMKHPLARIRMIDGFNEGWIDFEGDSSEHRGAKGELSQR